MIVCNKEMVEVKGSRILVCSELSILVRSLLEHGWSKEDIRSCVENGFMTEEELRASVEKVEKEMTPLKIAVGQLYCAFVLGGGGMYPKEDKQEICNALCAALKKTDNARDLAALRYLEESETVEIVFAGGTRRVNVAMDSGTAMIRDIMDNLGC